MELRNRVAALENGSNSVSTTGNTNRRWESFLVKGSQDKSTHDEVMMVEKMITETKARNDKHCD
jgi:hypothetical protein